MNAVLEKANSTANNGLKTRTQTLTAIYCGTISLALISSLEMGTNIITLPSLLENVYKGVW